MQVLQFKTVHLAVIGAIASVFGMAAENINAEPLLTYEQNKVVDNVLSNADAGTQGFLYLNKKGETYSGQNASSILCPSSIKQQERIRWFTLQAQVDR